MQYSFWFAEPYVPYTIEISAVTHAGEGDVNTIIQFTKEGSECTHVLLAKMRKVSLIPRPSTPPVFDRLQYAKRRGDACESSHVHTASD